MILIDEASADRLLRIAKKEGTIQYGYRTLGTHARVFSQTLAHGNNKNEIRQIIIIMIRKWTTSDIKSI